MTDFQIPMSILMMEVIVALITPLLAALFPALSASYPQAAVERRILALPDVERAEGWVGVSVARVLPDDEQGSNFPLTGLPFDSALTFLSHCFPARFSDDTTIREGIGRRDLRSAACVCAGGGRPTDLARAGSDRLDCSQYRPGSTRVTNQPSRSPGV